MSEQLTDTIRFKPFILYATFTRVRTGIGLRHDEAIDPTTETITLKKDYQNLPAGTELEIVTRVDIRMVSNLRLRKAVRAFKVLNAS